MNFQDLHELVRLEVLRRIERGELTGTRLAQQTGFRQGHISNFLNRKRALSLEGLDRVLAAQELTVDQILPVAITAVEATSPEVAEDRIEMVPIVSVSAAAAEGQILPSSVIDTIPVAALRLLDNRARPLPWSEGWQRFVAVRSDAQQASAMAPVLTEGSVAVIDRHYNSVAPYHAHQPTLYAVRCGAGLVLRYVEFDAGRLILRPASTRCAVQLIAMGENEMPGEYVVGRVCLVVSDL